MGMGASSEFVALCKSQVGLLSKGLGSSVSVVYLTEELAEDREAKLIPIVTYPETAVVWEENPARAIAGSQMATEIPLRPTPDFPPTTIPGETPTTGTNAPLAQGPPFICASSERPVTVHLVEPIRYLNPEDEPIAEGEDLAQHRQIVLPLIHEEIVMGLLVTRREDRPWTDRERMQIECIAQTIAIACILDRRQRWLSQQMRQHQRLQAEQHDLLDNLLHQVRSPLTALRTFGKLLLKRLREPDSNRDIAGSILRESDRVQELLQQMDLAIELEEIAAVPDRQTEVPSETPRLERRSPQLLLPAFDLEPCDIRPVLEPLLISALAIASERHLELSTDIPSELPPVLTYPKALREILSNLIDNALKYTPPGGKIYVKVGDQRQIEGVILMAIAISDTGIGIPPQDLERLFQRYYRGVKADSDIPGTGLGLAIARELITQMQGEIEVFSPTPPQWRDPNWQNRPSSDYPGTTFILWLQL
ncbi:HAMP domain-containing histidine kinase [Phormidium pseudopriestleyi FRX01]|uniref:histidine kinase n=2 Tax=Phormidium TaxID=1198 RepID=A0ABS3FL09_9CYAN|nr:HAMP domain-containing histidine kinase [Phormidium pseudopriestleyi FRX01]